MYQFIFFNWISYFFFLFVNNKMTLQTNKLLLFILIGIIYFVFFVVTSSVGGTVKSGTVGQLNKTGLFIIAISSCFFVFMIFGYVQITGLLEEKYKNNYNNTKKNLTQPVVDHKYYPYSYPYQENIYINQPFVDNITTDLNQPFVHSQLVHQPDNITTDLNQPISYDEKTDDIDGRFCRGGSYTWQGSSPRAVACRKLASTPEGLNEIRRYDCGAGFTGMPRDCEYIYDMYL